MTCNKCGRAVYGVATKRGNHSICPKRPHRRGYGLRISKKGHRRQKVNRVMTELKHINGTFADPDSFESLDGRVFLVGEDWQARCREVMFRAGLGCEKAGCWRVAVHIHHIKHRSKGGDDSLKNLMAICAEHHKLEHPEKRARFHEGATPNG